jgi:sulfur carrier protein ThiS adenylyltransferase
MTFLLNERPEDVPDGTRLFAVRDRFKANADIVILNGAVMRQDAPLANGDRVVLIRRGEQPPADEMEALLVARHTPGVHARVKGATVGIAGLGGLGSAIAIALARTGIGRLILVDFDVVEPSNLNRQQYFLRHLGMPKTEALAELLHEINPYVKVVCHICRITAANAPQLFGAADVLVEAFDVPDAKAELVAGFGQAFPDTPLVMASGLAGYGSGNSVRVHRLGKRLYVVGDLDAAARPGTGLMAPRVGVAAHLQANMVLRLLLGEEEE